MKGKSPKKYFTSREVQSALVFYMSFIVVSGIIITTAVALFILLFNEVKNSGIGMQTIVITVLTLISLILAIASLVIAMRGGDDMKKVQDDLEGIKEDVQYTRGAVSNMNIRRGNSEAEDFKANGEKIDFKNENDFKTDD